MTAAAWRDTLDNTGTVLGRYVAHKPPGDTGDMSRTAGVTPGPLSHLTRGADMKADPDICVDHCGACCFHELNFYGFKCKARVGDTSREPPFDRRFPKWCPLKSGPIVVAALKRGVK
ncbi:hypothetical protein LCGC14_2467370 [marine sediment metagenome]|uniref:Uncharacterized protein n=1 Tax=marine sediment metagenome TaxID=412755 RepID=A0A0F9BZ73_9ZZZZ